MPPDRLNAYVSNRVGDILTRVPSQHWRQVPTETNPADLASRGVSPKDLVDSQLWWQGPDWLSQSPETWPTRTDWRRKNNNLPELKTTILTVGPPEDNIVTHFSSYNRLLRVVTWCFRFFSNLRKPAEARQFSPLLSLQDLHGVELIFLRQSQQRFFLEEIDCIKHNRELPRKSRDAPS